MTAVAILKDAKGNDDTPVYRAVSASGTQCIGRTAGEALDALNAQMGRAQAGTIVIVQQMEPDEFFSEAQMSQLNALMERARDAELTSVDPLSGEERAELDSLIEAELLASARRTAALADAIGR